MADDEALTNDERRMWEYIQENDFDSGPWVTPDVARDLDMDEDEVYETLSGLGKKLKAEMYIFYKDGSLHIALRDDVLAKRK
jgi:hypothetical protein